jgi:type I restriction enzyme S subunit
MSPLSFSLPGLVPNKKFGSLPMFDRTGWKRVRFGDVVENCNETCDPEEAGLERFVAMEHLEPGSLHVRSWGNVADGTTFTRRCRPGQVLFGKRRAYQRKVAVAEFEAVVSGDIYVLAPKDQRLLPELLPFLCLSERFFQHAVGTSAGSLSPRTNWSSLASFEFDLPPLDQQRRIAEIFKSAATLHRRRLELSESLSVARDAKRASLFKGEHLRGQRFEISNWGVGRIPGVCDLPVGWRVEKLTSVARLESGHTPRRSVEGYWSGGNVPWISLQDTDGLKKRYIGTTAQMPTAAGIKNSSARLLPAGTVVFCRTASVGLCSIMEKEMSTSQDFANFVCGQEIQNEYLYHLLRWLTPVWDGLMGGSTHKTIYMPDFQKLEVILPPVEQQSFISRESNALDDAVEALETQELEDQRVLMALVNACL